jgi:hypothetical protein
MRSVFRDELETLMNIADFKSERPVIHRYLIAFFRDQASGMVLDPRASW